MPPDQWTSCKTPLASFGGTIPRYSSILAFQISGRQAQTEVVLQALIQLTHELGNGRPEAVLDDRKTPLGLVHRGRALLADLVGVPRLVDQLFDAAQQEVAFPLIQVLQFQLLQAVSYNFV